MDNELLNEIYLVNNHSDSTRHVYKVAVRKYTEFFSMTMSELIEEAELEEEQVYDGKKENLKEDY